MADKALKLRSPNFAVSATRLAVRNIPASMNEAGLKQLAVQAVRRDIMVSFTHRQSFVFAPRLQPYAIAERTKPFGVCQELLLIAVLRLSVLDCHSGGRAHAKFYWSALQVKAHASKAQPRVKQVIDAISSLANLINVHSSRCSQYLIE